MSSFDLFQAHDPHAHPQQFTRFSRDLVFPLSSKEMYTYRLVQKKGTVLLSTSLAWPAGAGCSRAETFSQLSSIFFLNPAEMFCIKTLLEREDRVFVSMFCTLHAQEIGIRDDNFRLTRTGD